MGFFRFKEGDMLVLSRKLGETVCIGTDITLSIVEVKGNRVKSASKPRDLGIWRGELGTEPTVSPAASFRESSFGD